MSTIPTAYVVYGELEKINQIPFISVPLNTVEQIRRVFGDN